jgi:hypothetical protein
LTKADDGDDRMQKESENAAHDRDGIKLKSSRIQGACGIRLPQARIPTICSSFVLRESENQTPTGFSEGM